MQVITNNNPPSPPTQLWPAIATGQPRISATHGFFILFAIVGTFLALISTPTLLLGPTLFIGGMLFFGFASILSYRNHMGVPPPTRGTGFLHPVVPQLSTVKPIADNTMRSESEMNADAAPMPIAAKVWLTLFSIVAICLVLASLWR